MKLLILIAGLALGLGAQAESARYSGSFYTPKQLSDWCNDVGDFGEMQCLVYILGVVDTLGSGQDFVNLMNLSRENKIVNPTPSPCLPDNVPLGQMKQVVTKYLNENPTNIHDSAAAGVRFALNEAFPCSYE